jgi:hypothetical protein
MRKGDACILDLSISPKLRQGLYFSRDLRANPTVEKPLIVADDLEEKHGALGGCPRVGSPASWASSTSALFSF